VKSEEAKSISPRGNKSTRAVRMPETQYKTGLSKTHIYRLIKLGLFPKPFKLSERAIAFFESDIDSWINQRRGESIA
jgi:prophage regulatory protein